MAQSSPSCSAPPSSPSTHNAGTLGLSNIKRLWYYSGEDDLPLDKNTQLILLWLLTPISISMPSQTAFCKKHGCATNPQENLLHLYHTDPSDSGFSNVFINSMFSSCILCYSTELLPAYPSGTAKHIFSFQKRTWQYCCQVALGGSFVNVYLHPSCISHFSSTSIKCLKARYVIWGGEYSNIMA